ncbi:FAD-dependent monooxygenase [Brachybacterium aquaticum]|uniref:2-polyprenyl-6-methoxyphenol hydroxylase-like FAD-dependent oxidoreductase n=1 Tax=Brachybacterium aquaticum TaxID=1432564 RepID=A0A841AF83_9MICO|nr:FAD-dependent monooxygenase [Brachybacterium aquaticum]MBB5832597.1 2-polyprenyl-6-methoxyphenol hydroxylase-like FAD-dependent oxidoreductase [Brachybacterium aquaticum]
MTAADPASSPVDRMASPTGAAGSGISTGSTAPTSRPLPRTVDVLVVGAGPTGLMAGLVAHRRGLSTLVVDGKSGPTRESRAIVVQARSMEILDQLALADPVLEGAQLAGRIRIRQGAAPIAADFGDAQRGWTPFPGARIFEQSRTEALLSETLAAEGAPVAYGHELRSFTADPDAHDGVDAVLSGPDGEVRVRTRWLIGADGASSPVRHQLGLTFDGVTDDATFCVADLHGVEGAAADALSARLGREKFAILFPLGEGGHARLIWLHGGDRPDQEEALAGVREDLGIRYERVDWFSSYRVHHRLASRFRVGPVLLAGDAAHVHSPVGGQGMNTGLQDAHHLVNLLADIASGLRDPAQIDRYEAERRPVAVTLVRSVDRAFGAVARPGRGTGFVRRRVRDVAGLIIPRVLRSPAGPRLAGLLGQYRIHYHPVPEGQEEPRWARDPAVGRRLRPTAENTAALRRMTWQLHTYGGGCVTSAAATSPSARPGEVGEAAVPTALRPQVTAAIEGPLAFPADPLGEMRPDRLYLVRPDGFVAAAWPLHAGAAASADVSEALAAYGFAPSAD